ncbi:MAG: heme exporter protein CcmD [Silicimonas sp.]|nr:heme exporter protein CcmD [Silicimonas sp.]
MPDLGKYAFEVILAYGGSFLALVALVALSVIQARRSKRRLEETERRRGNG